MRKTPITILCALATVACGGGATAPATGPTNPDPVPMVDPTPPNPDPVTDPAPPPDATADAEAIKTQLLATETAAFTAAEPVFEKFCAKCHRSGNKLATQKKLDHFDMTTYPFGGHHAMELGGAIRKALAIGGGKATMPKDRPGAVAGDELALIAAWADAFEASHAGGAHEGMPGHGAHAH